MGSSLAWWLEQAEGSVVNPSYYIMSTWWVTYPSHASSVNKVMPTKSQRGFREFADTLCPEQCLQCSSCTEALVSSLCLHNKIKPLTTGVREGKEL